MTASPNDEPRPPLLLLPGTACDQRVFAPLIDRLGDYPVLIGDMGGARTMAALAGDILAAAPPYFLLAGFSLGGICALEMVAQRPERIGKLALIDTTARPDPAENAAVRRKAVADAREKGMDGFILDNWPRLVAPTNVHDGSLRDTIVAMARDCGPDRLPSTRKSPSAAPTAGGVLPRSGNRRWSLQERMRKCARSMRNRNSPPEFPARSSISSQKQAISHRLKTPMPWPSS